MANDAAGMPARELTPAQSLLGADRISVTEIERLRRLLGTIAFALMATIVVIATTIHAAEVPVTDAPQAIDAAIEWLATHQAADGSWRDDQRDDPTAATSLALLAFFERGHTHKQGPYMAQCDAGLALLPGPFDEEDGRAESLASMALARALSLTEDKHLLLPAQLQLQAIATIPDAETTAVGWKLMALVSSHNAFLEVDPGALKKVATFLDSVAADEGATFGEDAPGDDPRASAAGLWACTVVKQDHPARRHGVEKLVKIGPTEDLVFDFFTTRVAHRVGGKVWRAWRAAMARRLLEAQQQDGPDAGAWLRGVSGGAGMDGPVSRTALAVLILETTLHEAKP